jgi:Protein of unknown function (DUF5818)
VTKMLLFALALLVPAARLQSQDTSPAGSSQTETAASDQITVEGCLQGTNGDYTLSDKSGSTYRLQGDTSNLSAHVGHEVQITGPTSGASAIIPSMATEAEGTPLRPALTVGHMKPVSEKCHAVP